MSKEEDFACDKFVPQKWRKDMCKICYQPIRLHEKKMKSKEVSSTATSRTVGFVVLASSARKEVGKEIVPPLKPPKPVKKTSSKDSLPQKPTTADLQSQEPVKDKISIEVSKEEDKEKLASKEKVESLKNEEIPVEELQTKEEVSVEELQTKEEVSVEELQTKEEVPVEELQTKEEIPVEELQTKEEVSVEELQTKEEVSVEELQTKEEIPVEELQTKEEIPVEELQTKEEVSVEELQTKEEVSVEELQTKEEIPVEELQTKEEVSVEELQTKEEVSVEELQTKEEIPVEELQTKEEVSVEELQTKEEVPVEELQTKEEVPVEELQTKEEVPVEELQTKEEVSTETKEDGDLQAIEVHVAEQLLRRSEEQGSSEVSTGSHLLLEELPTTLNLDIISVDDNSADRQVISPGIPPPPAPSPAHPVSLSPSPSIASLVPPPPPLPPPLPAPSQPIDRHIPHVRVLSFPRNLEPPNYEDDDEPVVSLPSTTDPTISEAREMAMEQIRSGVKLRPVTPPSERTPTEEKVVDIQSELRQKIIKKRKKEALSLQDQIENQRKEAQKLINELFRLQRTPSYSHILNAMLEKLKQFQATCGIPTELLLQKLNWPSQAIDALQEVVQLMTKFEGRIVDVENLCDKAVKTNQINVEIVKNCVTQVIMTARQVRNEHSQESRTSQALNTFPVDSIDIHRLLRRAGEAVVPLLDRLYEKALGSHALISDPSISKFDLNFRIQNSQRLLRMCCQMSDNLLNHLDVQKHPKYSEAMLKASELEEQYKKQLAILERKGNWDDEQEVILEPSYGKRSMSKDVTVVREITDLLIKGNGEHQIKELISANELTADLFQRAELQFIKAAISVGSTNVIDILISVRDQLINEEEARHRHDFDWLNEAVLKSSHQCLQHLVNVVGIPVNCQSADLGNSALHVAARRYDWSTMSCLIQLGANPLIENGSYRTPLQIIALKCFPPQTFSEVEVTGQPFDLSSYINNPSLSDGQLVSNEGEVFYIHRLILCGQSPVFKSLLESEHWTADRMEGNKVSLPTVTSRTMKLLLQYLYTGESKFNQDDLNTWIDLLAAADQFLLEPLRVQCEQTLSGKIDEEVVIPMLHAATRFSANKLLGNCCNFMLYKYNDVEDQGNETLLYVINNAESIMSKLTK